MGNAVLDYLAPELGAPIAAFTLWKQTATSGNETTVVIRLPSKLAQA
jgi:hypothetical protein